MESLLRSAVGARCGSAEAIRGRMQRSRDFRSASGSARPGRSRPLPRSSEEPGGWLMIEVGGEGAESSAGRCEVVAGEGGGVGGRNDARGAEQRPAGGVGL